MYGYATAARGPHQAGERGQAAAAAAVRAGLGLGLVGAGRAATGVLLVALGQARAVPEHSARHAARRASARRRRAQPPLVHPSPGRMPLHAV